MAPVEVVLAPGSPARVASTPLTITLERVGEDSRCPEGVNCVWAGDVEVTLRIEGGTARPTVATLHLHASPRNVAHGEYKVTLVGVAPAPKEGVRTKPEEYRATVRVE
jgi:hypothetical protein